MWAPYTDVRARRRAAKGAVGSGRRVGVVDGRSPQRRVLRRTDAPMIDLARPRDLVTTQPFSFTGVDRLDRRVYILHTELWYAFGGPG